MNKEVVSNNQGISLIVLFIIGSSSVFIMGMKAKQDLWLAIILAILMALPIALIYSRLHTLFPDKDLYDIIEICFGKFIGKIIILIITCFFFYWTSDVTVNYGNFIWSISLHQTPMIVPMVVFLALCSWGATEGIEVLGRWSCIFLIIPIVILFIIVALSIPRMDINNIFPILGSGFKSILEGSLNSFSFPLSQILAFSIVFSSFSKEKGSPYKIYVTGLIVGGLMLFFLSLTSVLVIGVDEAEKVYYSAYTAVSIINIGTTLQSVEAFISTTFLLGGFIKIALLVICTCKGLVKIFEFSDYRFIITPITLLIMNLTFFQYESIMYYYEFQTEVWLYLTLPFQLFLPIVIWIISEIKTKNSKYKLKER
ncbi:GerAB/ArcD/ProY family transporter [Tepidibacter hydrothermalis]|uniref:Endospore germination permease n=1 Tax=Tepidibacter hydrothermalis TaxID=3036126 RepID=A0ABY8EDH2_9FIRM|nr:endospore germination permease [Tepidibacter hydrothermalis]WFD10967.1 endospore germination permease [Tepidibacter hydrothermalis]